MSQEKDEMSVETACKILHGCKTMSRAKRYPSSDSCMLSCESIVCMFGSLLLSFNRVCTEARVAFSAGSSGPLGIAGLGILKRRNVRDLDLI